MTATAKELLREYERLRKIRRLPEHPLFSRPRHEQHYEQFGKIRSLVRVNQDALYELVFSGQLPEEYMYELMMFGAHGGSLNRKDNLGWVDFMARLRERQHELPTSIQLSLKWLLDVHGW